MDVPSMRAIESAREVEQVCRTSGRSLARYPRWARSMKAILFLMRRATAENGTLAVRVFVNPFQFGSPQDLARYPGDSERDLELLSNEATDLVFTPGPSQIYPPGFDPWIDVGALGDNLGGTQRPGRFGGVAMVVAKLFNIVRPDLAYFG